MNGDGHLGRPTLVRVRAQPVADHLLPPPDGGLGPSAFVVPGPALSSWRASGRARSRGSTAVAFTPPFGRRSPAATPGRPRRGRGGTGRRSSGAAADGSGRRSWRATRGTAGPARAT